MYLIVYSTGWLVTFVIASKKKKIRWFSVAYARYSGFGSESAGVRLYKLVACLLYTYFGGWRIFIIHFRGIKSCNED